MRFNRAEIARVATLLAELDAHFSDPAVRSKTIWRGDARAVRYALRKFMGMVGSGNHVTHAKRADDTPLDALKGELTK